MIICICANINEEEIRQAIAEGLDPVKELGVCSQCCICRDAVVKLVDDLNINIGV